MADPGNDRIRPIRGVKAIAGTPAVIWKAFRARAAIATVHRINGRHVSLAFIVGDAVRSHWRRKIRPQRSNGHHIFEE
jgi:hypothetical protein